MDVATGVTEWREMASIPRGAKCLLMTRNGIAVIGALQDLRQLGYVAWAPMPKVPDWLRDRLRTSAASPGMVSSGSRAGEANG